MCIAVVRARGYLPVFFHVRVEAMVKCGPGMFAQTTLLRIYREVRPKIILVKFKNHNGPLFPVFSMWSWSRPSTQFSVSLDR